MSGVGLAEAPRVAVEPGTAKKPLESVTAWAAGSLPAAASLSLFRDPPLSLLVRSEVEPNSSLMRVMPRMRVSKGYGIGEEAVASV